MEGHPSLTETTNTVQLIPALICMKARGPERHRRAGDRVNEAGLSPILTSFLRLLSTYLNIYSQQTLLELHGRRMG